MKILNVKTDNFRGGSSEIPLNGLDIITGPNGVGKTRILQAVQLAISGAVPHPIEDRNIDTLELFSREMGKGVMTVSLLLDNPNDPNVENQPVGYQRIYTLEHKEGTYKVSQQIDFSDGESRKVKESEAQIKEYLGDFPVMIDVHKFIRMSDEQRAQLMMQIGSMNIEKWNEASLREMLFSHCYQFELPTAILEKAISIYSPKLKADIRSGLFEMQEYFKKEEASLRKEMKTMSAAAQGAVALNVTNGVKSLRPTATINEDLLKAREDYTKLTNDLAKAKASREQFEKMKEEAVKLEESIRKAKESASEEKIAVLEGEILKHQKHVLPVPEEWTKRIIELTSQLEEANQLLIDARMKEHTAKANIVGMQEKWTLLSQGKCPTCGQECGEIADGITSAIETAVIELQDLTNDVLALTQRVANITEEDKNLTLKIAEHRERAVKSEMAINLHRSAIEVMRSEIKSYATMEARLKEVQEYKHDNAIDINLLEVQLASLEQKGKELNQEHTERIAYDTKVLQAKEAAKKMKEAEANLGTVKEIREKIRLLRWDIVREALEPIRTKATSIFRALRRQDTQFDFRFEDGRGNEVFQFGWTIKGEYGDMFVDFDSLSTSQQIFTLVAVLSPLIELGNPKLKLLMFDNVEVIDPEMRERFINILALAQEVCWLDNIIVASSGEFPRIENYGINYINLVAEAVA